VKIARSVADLTAAQVETAQVVSRLSEPTAKK
jgi:hypothetical protein